MDRVATATTDVFISHVEENYDVTLAVAAALEAAGYSVWYYERDSDGGPSYLVQTRDAIVSSQVMVLIVSEASLSSIQITKEVVRAHESGKPIVPLLVDVTDADYKRRQPEWEEAVGAATSLTIPLGGAAQVMPRVLRGLERLGVKASGVRATASVDAADARRTVAPAREGRAQSAAVSSVPPVRGPMSASMRLLVAAGIGASTLLAGFVNLSRVLSPGPGTADAALYNAVPGVQIWNLIANGVNLALDVVLLNGCWQVYDGRKRGAHLIRRAAGGMLIMDAVWLAMVLLSGLTSPNWPLFRPADQTAFLVGTLTIGCFAGVLAGAILYLFRRTA